MIKIVGIPDTTLFAVDCTAVTPDLDPSFMVVCKRCAEKHIREAETDPIIAKFSFLRGVFDSIWEFGAHMESEHCTPCIMPGQTLEDAIERVKVYSSQCLHCIEHKAPWVIIQ